jgi:hypothetical protein
MPITKRPGGWMAHLLAWQKTIQDKNKEREREAEARQQMAQEDILSQKLRERDRNGNVSDLTLPG